MRNSRNHPCPFPRRAWRVTATGETDHVPGGPACVRPQLRWRTQEVMRQRTGWRRASSSRGRAPETGIQNGGPPTRGTGQLIEEERYQDAEQRTVGKYGAVMAWTEAGSGGSWSNECI
ncbi:hypothetical protein BHE74_00022172 [Ensete ventricosum]|nr:hypothetical protein BHE74_00022172 [Ensete ventricosum]